MQLTFLSLSSGSSGNCYYIGNGRHGILVDAGISASMIRRFLAENGIALQTIMGILISHNHTDHIRGLEVLTRKNNIPAFSTRKIWKSVLTPDSRIPSDCIRELPMMELYSLAGFDIEVFPVSHDAQETIGFRISAGAKNITIITDTGIIGETMASYIRQSNLLVIESNYDEEMLNTGNYPYYLKQRIRSDTGHLGNHQTAGFLTGIDITGISHICLAHLSKNNNTPEKALEALRSAYEEKGEQIKGRPEILVLKRNSPSEMITLDL